MEFSLDVFGSNLDQAIKYIRVSKAINEDCRYRVETNVNDDTVKVYTIKNNKIEIITRFQGGKLVKEEKVGKENNGTSKD